MIHGQKIRYALIGDAGDRYYKATVNYVPDDWQWVELEIAGLHAPKLRRYPLSSFLWWEDE